MIGDDSDSGSEEEVVQSSSLVIQNSSILMPSISENSSSYSGGGWTPQRAGCISAEVDNDMNDVVTEIEGSQKKELMQPGIRGAASGGGGGKWTRHRSSRYRDAQHPQGYEYLFCADTGETKWVGEDITGGGAPTMEGSRPSKRAREEEISSSSLSSIDSNNITELSEGYIVKKSGDKVDYFCDQQKKWAFHTDLVGLDLLSHLVRLNQAALNVCKDKINSSENFQKVCTSYSCSFYRY